MAKMTLNEKLDDLLETVALPTNDNWGLGGDDAGAAVAALNAMLTEALTIAKETGCTYGKIKGFITSALGKICTEHPDCGIGDSETHRTIALFFGLNYTPEIYNFLRYPNAILKGAVMMVKFNCPYCGVELQFDRGLLDDGLHQLVWCDGNDDEETTGGCGWPLVILPELGVRVFRIEGVSREAAA